AEDAEALPGRPDVAAFRRRLDATLFAYKADLFAEHALAARGRAASPAEREAARAAFAAVAREAQAAPARLAHRDFQSANLHVLQDRPPGERLAVIDLQGALLAPPEYDLVCLLRDSYVALPEDEVAHQLARIRPRLPDAPDPEVFARRFDLLTPTRKGKDVARFLYAARERGDRRYLVYVPATLAMLRGAAQRSATRDPAYAALAELVAEIPESPCAR
ncbi:MAG: phosphotransferase, partial [Myxococcota bacterium]